GGGDSGDHIRGSRPRGRDRNPHLSTGPRVAVSHVGCALLVAHQHVMDLAVLQRVIGGQNGAAGIAKDVLHAFPFQTFPKDTGAGHCLRLGLGLGLNHGWRDFRIGHATSLRWSYSDAIMRVLGKNKTHLASVSGGWDSGALTISSLSAHSFPRTETDGHTRTTG